MATRNRRAADSVHARLDRIELGLDTLMLWVERTAGHLVYSPRAADGGGCVMSLSGAAALARLHCPREPQETTEAWLKRCDRLGEQIQDACARVVRKHAADRLAERCVPLDEASAALLRRHGLKRRARAAGRK